MDVAFRTALEKALGLAIGMMAIEISGRIAFNLSLATEIAETLTALTSASIRSDGSDDESPSTRLRALPLRSECLTRWF